MQEVTEQAAIYKSKKRPLKGFKIAVNTAAAALCVRDISLLTKRGELLEKARKQAADGGYTFKKDRSRSKVYGKQPLSPQPKRPKFDKDMREERLKQQLQKSSKILGN